MKEQLVVTRNFLYRFFVIGFLANLAFQLFFLFIGAKGLDEASKILELPPYFLSEMLILSIAVMRIILLYFVLFPAFAIHWTLLRDKQFKSEEDYEQNNN